MQNSLSWWIAFNLFVVAMLVLDLGVLHRKAHAVSFREAITWTIVWIALALLFNLGLLLGWFGNYAPEVRSKVAVEFFTGYLIEKSLSIDNVFVFLMIFSYFIVPAAYQHRVLFFGILGALIFRAAFIFGGLWLIQKFSWTLYLFALLLIGTGVKMAIAKGKEIHPEKNPILRLTRRLIHVTPDYVGAKFFTRIEGRLWSTPLLLVLIIIETSDIIFAVDSIPAIIAITTDPFIVYTSNVFAILGLRALYFALANFMQMFHHLTYGLAVLLVFIGVKMFLGALLHFHLSAQVSLGIVALIIWLSIVASFVWPAKKVIPIVQDGAVVPLPEAQPP